LPESINGGGGMTKAEIKAAIEADEIDEGVLRYARVALGHDTTPIASELKELYREHPEMFED
jgi:hypothetical protein